LKSRASEHESEWLTRKRRIDPKLDARGWCLAKGGVTPLREPYRTEEEETNNGPADYALWLDNHITAVVEVKKLTIGPQNVLVQAERYARGVKRSRYNFDGLRVPDTSDVGRQDSAACYRPKVGT
jgi:type I restriction enzyme R subunit